LRIGIDASNLRVGGGLTHLYQLLEKADPGSHRFNEITVWAGKSTLQGLPARNTWLNLVHDPMLDRPLPFRLYWQNWKLPKLARRSCDILFIPGGGSGKGFSPFVTMSRNLLPFESSEKRRYGLSWQFLRISLLRFSQALAFRKANGVIFLTEYARSVVMKTAKNLDGRWALIPHGIDKRFVLSPREQKPMSAYSREKPFRLLYVSIVDVYKHQWQVVEAVARLRAQGMPIELDLVGPAYLPALRRLQQVLHRFDPSQSFIHYRGSVSYSKLPTYYHEADLFIFASSCENMPNILLEAMASGLPIACSNRGSMPEILGDYGVYFNPEGPDEIIKALCMLIEDRDLRERCANGSYSNATTYSWERCANETFGFIKQVAEQYYSKRS
jgi:glycosyltransferase involved in cell wall biosynthesis